MENPTKGKRKKKFTSNIKKFIGEDEKKKKTEKIRSETLLENCGANLWSRSRPLGIVKSNSLCDLDDWLRCKTSS